MRGGFFVILVLGLITLIQSEIESCPDNFEPICVVGKNVLFETAQNECWISEGYGKVHDGKCSDSLLRRKICNNKKYHPVCAAPIGTKFSTFCNSCRMKGADFVLAYKGNCSDSLDTSISPNSDLSNNIERSYAHLCFAVYNPICGAHTPEGKLLTTFNNDCAIENGYFKIHNGRCARDKSADNRICPLYLNPICTAPLGTHLITLPNSCYMKEAENNIVKIFDGVCNLNNTSVVPKL